MCIRDRAHTARWLVDGSPAGITVDYDLSGVLEPVLDEDPLSIDSLVTDHSHENYRGVESDPEALAIIDT